MPIVSHRVAWVCGDFLEVLTTREAIYYDTGASKVNSVREKREKESGFDASFRSAYRAQRQARRLINTNRLYFMWTLTFAPDSEKNKEFDCLTIAEQKNREVVFTAWKYFLRRSHRSICDRNTFKWLMILERHDSFKTHPMKKDTFHIHLATNHKVKTRALQEVWKHGICNVQDFMKKPSGEKREEIENPGAYISKYIAKEVMSDDREQFKKRYSTSRGLKKPIKVGVPGQIDLLLGYTRKCIRSFKSVIQTDEGKQLIRIQDTYRIDRRDSLESLLLNYFREGGTVYGE